MLSKPPPEYPEQLTIALFGKKSELKKVIGQTILNNRQAFGTLSNDLDISESGSFKVIITPDVFDEECLYLDQQIIDFMALADPGPNLFILVIDSEHIQEQEVVVQIMKLQSIFGETLTTQMLIMLPDIASFHSLSHLIQEYSVSLAIANENLAHECRRWCARRQPFLFDFRVYSQAIVLRRKEFLKAKRCGSNAVMNYKSTGFTSRIPPTSPDAMAPEFRTSAVVTPEAPVRMHTIVLMGLTGTGKSASANTILAALNSNLSTSQIFKSGPSSMPVTTVCSAVVTGAYGAPVRVVDTPDFFSAQLANSQAQLEECKKYCEAGKCAILLVLQLGRLSDTEKEIIPKLEQKIGWNIRESTIILLTHGDDLKNDLGEFVNANDPLRSIISLCGGRYHLFNNNSKSTKQVKDLLMKIPNSQIYFPKLSEKAPQCCVC